MRPKRKGRPRPRKPCPKCWRRMPYNPKTGNFHAHDCAADLAPLRARLLGTFAVRAFLGSVLRAFHTRDLAALRALEAATPSHPAGTSTSDPAEPARGAA